MATYPSDWSELKKRMPVGTHISGLVSKHKPYGFFVDIHGVSFEGLVQITDFREEAHRATPNDYPPLGEEIQAVVLGFKETGKQIWLGMKSNQLTPKSHPSPQGSQAQSIKIGMKLTKKGGVDYFGLEELNEAIRNGAQVKSIEKDTVLMKKTEHADSVSLKLIGFSLLVALR